MITLTLHPHLAFSTQTSLQTLRWREVDSNDRFRVRLTPSTQVGEIGLGNHLRRNSGKRAAVRLAVDRAMARLSNLLDRQASGGKRAEQLALRSA